MMGILVALNNLDDKRANLMLKNLSNENLNILYENSVELKKSYQTAYERLNNELNRRVNDSIEKTDSNSCKTLEVDM